MEALWEGKVKWFDLSKGYGFIICKELKKEVFFHSTQYMTEGIVNPKVGEEVEFQVFDDKGKLKAMNVYKKESP